MCYKPSLRPKGSLSPTFPNLRPYKVTFAAPALPEGLWGSSSVPAFQGDSREKKAFLAIFRLSPSPSGTE